MRLQKLLAVCALVLLAGAVELAYGALTGSMFFMVYGVPAAFLGGLGVVILQAEGRHSNPEE